MLDFGEKHRLIILKTFGRRRLFIGVAAVSVGLFFWYLDSTGMFNIGAALGFLDERPLYGILVFVIFYSASVVVMLPTLPLNLLAGYLWGAWVGGLYTAIAVSFGALISFLLARSVFGQPLSRKFKNKSFVLFEKSLEEHGWKFVAFVRLNPIFPTGPINYLFGFTAISVREFFVASFIFLLPGSMIIAYLGETFQTFVSGDEDVTKWVYRFMIISLLITVLAGVVFMSRMYLKRQDHQ